MMLSPVEQGHGRLAGVRHINTHVVMRRTRSAFARLGAPLRPHMATQKLCHIMVQASGGIVPASGMARDLRSVQAVFPLKTRFL
jgi:urease accessory protein UreH